MNVNGMPMEVFKEFSRVSRAKEFSRVSRAKVLNGSPDLIIEAPMPLTSSFNFNINQAGTITICDEVLTSVVPSVTSETFTPPMCGWDMDKLNSEVKESV